MEKIALALVFASRRLHPYFQAHKIHILSHNNLRQILLKHEASGHLAMWTIELDEFDLEYHAQLAIKGQTLALEPYVGCKPKSKSPIESFSKG